MRTVVLQSWTGWTGYRSLLRLLDPKKHKGCDREVVFSEQKSYLVLRRTWVFARGCREFQHFLRTADLRDGPEAVLSSGFINTRSCGCMKTFKASSHHKLCGTFMQLAVIVSRGKGSFLAYKLLNYFIPGSSFPYITSLCSLLRGSIRPEARYTLVNVTLVVVAERITCFWETEYLS